MNEIEEISEFIRGFTISDSIPDMEQELAKSIGYGQRVGELLNDAEFGYRKKYADRLDELGRMEEETETTRKGKLESWTAEEKRLCQNLKLAKNSLRTIQMSLMQAIKTRRSELDLR